MWRKWRKALILGKHLQTNEQIKDDRNNHKDTGKVSEDRK